MIQQSRMSSSEYGGSALNIISWLNSYFFRPQLEFACSQWPPKIAWCSVTPVQPNTFLVCCCRLTVCSQQVKLGLLVNEMLSLSSTIFPKHILCHKNFWKEFGSQAKKKELKLRNFASAWTLYKLIGNICCVCSCAKWWIVYEGWHWHITVVSALFYRWFYLILAVTL